MKLENIVSRARSLYSDNRIVNINANILAAAAPSIVAAAGASEIAEHLGCGKEMIALTAAITDWAVYVPVHVSLHYRSNRARFIREDGSPNCKAFVKDVAHVYATQLPSIGLFYALAGPLHYALMRHGVSSGWASQVSYWGTMITTRAVHTLIGLKTGLFRRESPDGSA